MLKEYIVSLKRDVDYNLSDYLNNRSSLSTKNKFLYDPFNALASQSGGAVGLTGPLTLTNGTITLT